MTIYLIYSDRRADNAFFDEKEKLGRYCHLILCNEMQRELGLHDYKAYKALEKHIRAIEQDIVHCHSSKAGIVGRMAAKHCRVPKIIYTPNAYAFESPDISRIKKAVYIFAERYLSRHATTMTINVSKGEMSLAKKHKLDKEDKFTLIYNGIPDIELPSKEELKKECQNDSGNLPWAYELSEVSGFVILNNTYDFSSVFDSFCVYCNIDSSMVQRVMG